MYQLCLYLSQGKTCILQVENEAYLFAEDNVYQLDLDARRVGNQSFVVDACEKLGKLESPVTVLVDTETRLLNQRS